MKRIELKSLHLKNFQGLRDYKIDFVQDVTNIFGDNATGKTTLNNAFRWLLFDKDSTDRKQFEIKTLDKNNEPIHGLDHTVIGELYVNNQLKTLQKTYKEKWTKKRGEAESTFTGHETLYFINDVPAKASEYQKEISNIVDEKIFKLITNPLYFSSIMGWQERRKILLDIVGEPSVNEVIGKNDNLNDLKELLKESDVDTLRKSLAARRKKLNDELKTIPVRIDECNNSIVEVNTDELSEDLKYQEAELERVENQLSNAIEEDPAITEKKQKLNELRSQIAKIETDITEERFDENKRLQSALRKLQSGKTEKQNLQNETNERLNRLDERAARLNKEIEQYRNDWDVEKAKEFELKEDFTCPTCKRKLPDDEIKNRTAELKENFNKNKAERLKDITEDGKAARALLSSVEDQIEEKKKNLESFSASINQLDADIKIAEAEIADFEDSDPEYPDELLQLKAKAVLLVDELETPADVKSSVEDLRNTKKQLTNSIDSLKSMLRKEETNIQQRARIEELSLREREVSQQIADLEKIDFQCETFIKTKVELLDEKINSMFSYVRFKLFEEQINGGLTETCEALIDGVPFSDANNAAKINAGIDIINTLSGYYKVSAPIVIDNRESINEIIPTSAQVINLIVSHDKQLKVA